MTPSDFTGTLESFYNWSPPDIQRRAYEDRLSRFDTASLDQLAIAVIDNSKWFPKIAEILSIAQANSIWPKRAAARATTHDWEKTDCPLCEGEGRLVVVMRHYYTPTLNALGETKGFHEQRDVANIYPYCTPRGSIPHAAGDYTYIFRCFCDAALAATVPQWIPRWRK